MTTQHPNGLPVARDADAAWIDHQVATRLFGAMPRKIGRYAILETLGSGGMGLVYRAHDEQLGRMVAVKLLNADYSTADGARLMHREAQAMARLSHANVVHVYEVGQHREQVFLAMEYVEGETLEVWLRRAHPPRVVLALFRAVGEGIAAAHAVGVTHRDLKPANILVDGTGRPRVADFGLARTETPLDLEQLPTLHDSQGEASRITAVGQILGTPRYMSPEQHAGEQATARSDQFSFCMMLWEALCGELPFADGGAVGRSPGARWTRRPPPRGRRLPAQVREALTRGLQVEPSRRWPSMAALLAVLGRPSLVRRYSWLLIPAVLTAGVGAGAMVVQLGNDGPQARAPVCDPNVDPMLRHAREQVLAWRAALATSRRAPEVRRHLGRMLDDWSTEVHDVCDASLRPASPQQSRELLRRGACSAQGAALLQLWLVEDEAAPASGGPTRGGLERPVGWDGEGLGRSCLLDDEHAYDLLRGAVPAERGHTTQELLSVRLLLALGRPREALARLAALPRRHPAVLPASYHVLRARALGATGADEADVLDALYAAEDEAELSDDLHTLFEARIEQVRVAVDAQSRAQQFHQVAPLPALAERWERKLASAGTTLRRLELTEGDEMLRWLAVRADLAASRRDRRTPMFRRQLVDAADRFGSARLRAEVYSDHAGSLDGAEAAAFDARAISIAPDDDELRGYLNYQAGLRAFDRGDLELGISTMKASAELYGRAFGPDAPQIADVEYAAAQRLYEAGESAVALTPADAAVHGSTRASTALAHATTLQLRSAIHLRLGRAALAVRDAEAALAVLTSQPNTHDIMLWRTSLEAALVESRVALGDFAGALELAAAVTDVLAAVPAADLSGQSDELQLAMAAALHGLGRHRDAADVLARAERPDFLEYDDFKRADALLLRASLPGGSAADRQRWRRSAAELLTRLGHDGAARLAAAQIATTP